MIAYFGQVGQTFRNWFLGVCPRDLPNLMIIKGFWRGIFFNFQAVLLEGISSVIGFHETWPLRLEVSTERDASGSCVFS